MPQGMLSLGVVEMKNFGKRLKKIRKSKNISQKKLAEYLGVGQSTIANYENNLRFPNMEKLRLLSEYLGVNAELILGSSQESEKHPNNPIEIGILKENFFSLLMNHEEEEAKELVQESVRNGLEPVELYENIFSPILQEVGQLWEKNNLGVGTEHYITAIISDIISKIPLKKQILPNPKRVLLMTPESEGHYIGIKMLKNILERYGWKTFLVGNSIPFTDLTRMLRENKIDVLALSVTLNEYINPLGYIISGIKKMKEFKELKIMVGGQATHVKDIDKTLPEVDYFIKDLYEIETLINEF